MSCFRLRWLVQNNKRLLLIVYCMPDALIIKMRFIVLFLI